MSDTEVIAQITELHKPYKIWDSCDCDIQAGYDDKPPGHVYITEIGWTCNYMYSICRECCMDDEYQSESCANYHSHSDPEMAICPTVAIIAKSAPEATA